MHELGGDFLEGDDIKIGIGGDGVEDGGETGVLEEGIEPDVPGKEGD